MGLIDTNDTIDGMASNDWFACIEPRLHTWNESKLVVVNDFLDSVNVFIFKADIDRYVLMPMLIDFWLFCHSFYVFFVSFFVIG